MPTLKEIYEGQSNWVFGTNYTSLKSDTETLVEQETSGIRIKSAVEINNPLIYGNESIRISNRTTKSVEDMKNSMGGESSDGGLIGLGISKLTGGKLNSISDVRNFANNKLGIPANAIPTYVDGTGELQKGKEPDTMITLAKIKKDASGTEVGKFLKQAGGGNFRTIGRNIIGEGISLVKDKLRDTLFGSPAGLGENSPTNGSYEYSSINPYSSTISIAKNTEPNADKLQLVQTQAKEKVDALKSKTADVLKKNKKVDEKVEDKSTDDTNPYSVQNQNLVVKDSRETNIQTLDSETETDLKKDTAEKLNKKKTLGDSISSNSALNSERNYSNESPYTENVNTYVTEESVETDLKLPTQESTDDIESKTKKSQDKNLPLDESSYSVKYDNDKRYSDFVRKTATDDEQSGEFTRIDLSLLPQNSVDKTSKLFRLKRYSKNPYNNTLRYPKAKGEGGTPKNWESLYGVTNGSDRLNSEGLNGNTEELEGLDLIPFWIKPKEGKSIHFRTSVSGITETVNPQWASSKFFGNPFSFYTYDGVERNVALTLQMFCYNPVELATMWQKIEFLTKQTYPKVKTVNDIKYSNPPIIEFRLGDIYKNKTSFIESLSYTIPDNSNWEVDIDGLRLPKLVDVSITFKFIEQIGDEQTLYSYKRSDDAIKIVNEKRGSQGGNFSGDSQTGGGASNIGGGSSAESDNFAPSEPAKQPPKVDNTGVEQTEENNQSSVNNTPKVLDTGKESTDNPKDTSTEQTKERTKAQVITEAEKIKQKLSSKGLPEWFVNWIPRYPNFKDGTVKKIKDPTDNTLELVYYELEYGPKGYKYTDEYVVYVHPEIGRPVPTKYKQFVSFTKTDPVGTQGELLKQVRDNMTQEEKDAEWQRQKKEQQKKEDEAFDAALGL
jgi:hypothetical protein